jgi:hypothetical protein
VQVVLALLPNVQLLVKTEPPADCEGKLTLHDHPGAGRVAVMVTVFPPSTHVEFDE